MSNQELASFPLKPLLESLVGYREHLTVREGEEDWLLSPFRNAPAIAHCEPLGNGLWAIWPLASWSKRIKSRETREAEQKRIYALAKVNEHVILKITEELNLSKESAAKLFKGLVERNNYAILDGIGIHPDAINVIKTNKDFFIGYTKL